jgi:hypothetical protein
MLKQFIFIKCSNNLFSLNVNILIEKIRLKRRLASIHIIFNIERKNKYLKNENSKEK